MWFMSILPNGAVEWIVHGLVVLGITLSIVGAIVKNIVGVSEYGILAKAVGALCLLAGVFFEGGYVAEKSYMAQIEEARTQAALAEARSQDKNKEISDAVKTQMASVKATQAAIQTHIDEVSKKLDSQCVIDPEAISILNSAALGVKK